MGWSTRRGLWWPEAREECRARRPAEIEAAAASGVLAAEPQPLVYASKMAAKVDSAGLQDGYQIYHHSFFFTTTGKWAVVQQGMNDRNRKARRYHWLSDTVSDYVVEPHQAVASQAPGTSVLNLVARESLPAQTVVAQLAGRGPTAPSRGSSGSRSSSCPAATPSSCATSTPRTYARSSSPPTSDRRPTSRPCSPSRESGPKTIRALTLIAELVYDSPASRSDPALFSYAHGGKDGFPYPVDRERYDQNTEILRRAVLQAKLGRSERLDALRRLALLSDKAS